MKLTKTDADNLRKCARGKFDFCPNLTAWMLSLANTIEKTVENEKNIYKKKITKKKSLKNKKENNCDCPKQWTHFDYYGNPCK